MMGGMANEQDAVSRIMNVAESGYCTPEEGLLALGAYMTYQHHPALLDDLYDGTVDLVLINRILRDAGLEAVPERGALDA